MSVSVCLMQLVARGAEPREERLTRVAERAAGVEADLIVLPELWPTGFFAFDRYHAEAESLDGPTATVLAAVARNAGSWVVGGSFLEQGASGQIHNTCVVVDPRGDVAACYRKTHLFGFQSRERDLVAPGGRLVVVETEFGRIGLSLCYDLRFPELYRVLAGSGAEILVVAAAWPAARRSHWDILLRARAVENQAYVLGCAGVGDDHGVLLGGSSAVIGPTGEIVAAGEQAGDEVIHARIDLDELRALRRSFPVLADRRTELLLETSSPDRGASA